MPEQREEKTFKCTLLLRKERHLIMMEFIWIIEGRFMNSCFTFSDFLDFSRVSFFQSKSQLKFSLKSLGTIFLNQNNSFSLDSPNFSQFSLNFSRFSIIFFVQLTLCINLTNLLSLSLCFSHSLSSQIPFLDQTASH